MAAILSGGGNGSAVGLGGVVGGGELMIWSKYIIHSEPHLLMMIMFWMILKIMQLRQPRRSIH